VLRVETKGAWFIRVRGNEIRRMTSDPNLENAEKLRFDKSGRSVRMSPMKPMEPMKPMKPLKPMRRMEMRMGDVQMSMGGGESHEESTQHFRTECDMSVKASDRFCRHCGSRLQWASDTAVVVSTGNSLIAPFLRQGNRGAQGTP
jgi:hypothetical protein